VNAVRAGTELKNRDARLPPKAQLFATTERNWRAVHRQGTDFQQGVGFAVERGFRASRRKPCEQQPGNDHRPSHTEAYASAGAKWINLQLHGPRQTSLNEPISRREPKQRALTAA
jgi:hypothetical protein